MKRVWVYTIKHVRTWETPKDFDVTTCFTSAEAAKRRVEESRQIEMKWVETTNSIWIGDFIHFVTGDRMQAFVYSIPVVEDE